MASEALDAWSAKVHGWERDVAEILEEEKIEAQVPGVGFTCQ